MFFKTAKNVSVVLQLLILPVYSDAILLCLICTVVSFLAFNQSGLWFNSQVAECESCFLSKEACAVTFIEWKCFATVVAAASDDN